MATPKAEAWLGRSGAGHRHRLRHRRILAYQPGVAMALIRRGNDVMAVMAMTACNDVMT